MNKKGGRKFICTNNQGKHEIVNSFADPTVVNSKYMGSEWICKESEITELPRMSGCTNRLKSGMQCYLCDAKGINKPDVCKGCEAGTPYYCEEQVGGDVMDKMNKMLEDSVVKLGKSMKEFVKSRNKEKIKGSLEESNEKRKLVDQMVKEIYMRHKKDLPKKDIIRLEQIILNSDNLKQQLRLFKKNLEGF